MRRRKLDHDLVFTWLAPVALAGLLSACGGGDQGGGGGADTAAGGVGAGAPPPAAGDTAPAGGAGAGAGADTGAAPADTGGAGGAAGAGGSKQLTALGDSIFHGQVGGATCYVCHGQDAKGTGVGPNLTDAEWLNTDGTLAGITGTIQSGVAKPKKAPAPMPPMGGASLSPDQVKAVAAYVHSLGGGK
jgi:mono/diheme cytochrome c family protein